MLNLDHQYAALLMLADGICNVGLTKISQQLCDGLPLNIYTDIHGAQRMNPIDFSSHACKHVHESRTETKSGSG